MIMSLFLFIAQRQGVVVLFSNDNMLCVKAKINNVISCNRKVTLHVVLLLLLLLTDFNEEFKGYSE